MYKNTKSKVEILCLVHNLYFQQYPKDHLQGIGCIFCAKINRANKQKKSIEDFILDANNIHNNFYSYDKVIYINALSKIIINCPSHGEYLQTPNSHLSGRGCPICGIESRVKNFQTKKFSSFLEEANIIHEYKYEYFDDLYINSFSKIKIKCHKHGLFLQRPNSHLTGVGCPSCGKICSKQESDWLDSLNIPKDKDHRQVYILIKNKRYFADGYNPITKTVYEFYGDKWHGNPKIYDLNKIDNVMKISYKDAYNRTITRENILKNAGYNIVSIWESEWRIKK